MTEDQDERLVTAFERIAIAFEGIHDAAKRAGEKFWPEQKQPREAKVSYVETEEDILKRQQSAANTVPITEWLKLPGEDEEFVGQYEREFLERQKSSAESGEAGPDAGSLEPAGSPPPDAGEVPPDNPTP